MYNRSPTRRAMTPPSPYDRWFAFVVLTLLGLGLLMVASASIVISDAQLHQPFYYFYRQLIFVVLGFLLGAGVIQIDTSLWERMAIPLLVVTIALLVMVLIPGIGRSVNGSVRWIHLGFMGLQVSEVAKFVAVVYMADYLVRCQLELKTTLTGFLKPMGVLAIMALLLLKEPDFGAIAVLMSTVLGMMFLGGMRIRYFLILFVLVVGALALLAFSAPYRLHRLTSFLDPWTNPFGSGYQLTQSLIAFGRGGWFGVGLGKSIQKLFYLPESHTDFLFAVIAEELGIIGIMVVLALFTVLILRIFYIARQSQELGGHFKAFLAYGFGLWFAIQFIVSLGVNTGMLPTKGLTLPLMSYGGSSMIMTSIAIALILRIDYENRMTALGLRT